MLTWMCRPTSAIWGKADMARTELLPYTRLPNLVRGVARDTRTQATILTSPL